MYRTVAITALTTVGAFASVQLASTEYRFGVLNQSIEVPKDIMTFKEVLNLVQESTGYNVANKVDEIPLDKKYAGLKKYKVVGDLLNAVLEGYDAVVDVDKEDYIIKIIYPETIYIDLPYSWPMETTNEYFKRNFPYVNFYIEGNRITAYGIPRDIAKLVPVFKRYQENAYKKTSFRISLYPYCTNVKKYVFLARRKYYGSEQYKPIKYINVSLGQGEKVAISYRDVNINMTYDKADGIMRVGKFEIPLNVLFTTGVAFRVVSLDNPDIPGGLINYLLNNKKPVKCDDVIITVDKTVIPY